jgi:hypothetical protein
VIDFARDLLQNRCVARPEPAAPNTGRIIDYWLGGLHHFTADRAAAAAYDAIYGDFPRVFRTLRDFVGRASRYIAAQGVDQFVVLGSGIPTRGNVHEAVPSARVAYTDIDPLNIELGAQILAGSPHTGYGYCDGRDFSTLDTGLVEHVLGPKQRLGVVVVGCTAFISDDRLRALYAALHAWTPAGSFLAFDFDSREHANHPAVLALLGDDFVMRTPSEFAPLLGPWQVTEDGIAPVAAWRSEGAPAAIPTFMYGGVAHKSDSDLPG